jgi:hypothetical protein
MLTATYHLTLKPDDTCTWHYTCANSIWAETPTTVRKPVPVAAVKAEIARHFAGLGPGWNKRVYVNGRRVNRRQFLKKSTA